MNRLIFLGPLENKLDRTLTGGAIVQFKCIIEELDRRAIEYAVIDTNKHNYPSKLVAFLTILFEYLKQLKKDASVVYFTSSNYTYFLPIFIFFKKIVPYHLYVRKIGGDIGTKTEELRKAVNLFKRVDLVLTESKGLEKILKENDVNAMQFLNARNSIPSIQYQDKSLIRLVYFGRICKSKGLLSLIEIDKQLPENVKIHIYGATEDLNEVPFLNLENVHYGGRLTPEQVTERLNDYDAVILPTHFSGEGHPGMIIEAFMQARPVLATDWNFISELVKDGENGVLFKSNSSEDILNGIKRFCTLDYTKLSENAKKTGMKYDIKQNVDKLLKTINYAN